MDRWLFSKLRAGVQGLRGMSQIWCWRSSVDGLTLAFMGQPPGMGRASSQSAKPFCMGLDGEDWVLLPASLASLTLRLRPSTFSSETREGISAGSTQCGCGWRRSNSVIWLKMASISATHASSAMTLGESGGHVFSLSMDGLAFGLGFGGRVLARGTAILDVPTYRARLSG